MQVRKGGNKCDQKKEKKGLRTVKNKDLKRKQMLR